MDNKIFKILFVTIGACIVAVLVFLYGPKTAEATYQEHKVTICHKGQTIEVSAIAALHHLRQHEEDYRGECKQEEPKDYCEYLDGVQGEDEDCPKPEPTCEELQNCEPEEPPVVVPEEPKKDTPDRPKFTISQGPNGVVGDGVCQVQFKKIKGSKKVEYRYAGDSIFGNGYKSGIVEDGETIWVKSDGGKLKIRGRDSKTDWSKAKSYSC